MSSQSSNRFRRWGKRRPASTRRRNLRIEPMEARRLLAAEINIGVARPDPGAPNFLMQQLLDTEPLTGARDANAEITFNYGFSSSSNNGSGPQGFDDTILAGDLSGVGFDQVISVRTVGINSDVQFLGDTDRDTTEEYLFRFGDSGFGASISDGAFVPLIADMNGDGIDDAIVVDTETDSDLLEWYVSYGTVAGFPTDNSFVSVDSAFRFGVDNDNVNAVNGVADVPRVADVDGDGRGDAVAVRDDGASLDWYVTLEAYPATPTPASTLVDSASDQVLDFGSNAAIPVTGAWDSNSSEEYYGFVTEFPTGPSLWSLNTSDSNNVDVSLSYGLNGDQYIVGAWPDHVWDGGGGNSLFSNAANWSGDILPAAASDVVIDQPQSSSGLSADVTLSIETLSTTEFIDVNGELTVGSSTTDDGGFYSTQTVGITGLTAVLRLNDTLDAPALNLSSGKLQLGVDNALAGVPTFSISSASIEAVDGARVFDSDFTVTSLVVIEGSQDLTLSGNISGTGGLEMQSGAVAVLQGSNTYSGDTVAGAGTLRAGSTTAFPADSVLEVGSLGRFELNGFNTSIGSLTGTTGAVIDLGGNRLTFGLDGGFETYGGDIVGTGEIYKVGTGTQVINGPTSYSGASRVVQGQLYLTGSGTLGTPGNGTVIDGGGEVRLGAGTFAEGLIALDGATVIGDDLAVLSGEVRNNAGANLTLRASGADERFELSGSVANEGTMTIDLGIVELTGTVDRTGEFVVASGAVLAGATGVGALGVPAVTVQSSGTLAPGSSPGIFNTGDFDLQLGSTLEIELGGSGANPGTDYDQVNVTGTVTLAGALDVSLFNSFVPTPGDQFIIINNDLADAVSGTFDGLAEGDLVTDGVNFYTISYASSDGAADGNDVVLTAVAPTFTSVDVVDGDLVISDTNGNDDQLSITTVGTDFVISVPVGDALSASVGSGDGTSTITVPFSAITGTQVIVNTGGGNDSITIGGVFAPGNIAGSTTDQFDLLVDGQAGTDTITWAGASTLDVIALTAEGINLGANADGLTSVTFDGPVSLTGNTTVTSAQVTFTDTVDGAAALSTNTNGGVNARFQGEVGGTTPLTQLGTFGEARIEGGAVTTTGFQYYQFSTFVDSPTDLTTFTSTGGGLIRFGQATSESLQSVTDGEDGIVINTAGQTWLDARIGTTGRLASITTDAVGTLRMGSIVVNTTGAQSFDDPMTLFQDMTFSSTSGGNITFGSTVDGARAVAVNTSGTTEFQDLIGDTQPLTSLSTDAGGTTRLNVGGSSNGVATTGDMNFNDAVEVSTADLVSSAGNINFQSTVEPIGSAQLFVSAAGTITANGAIGDSAPFVLFRAATPFNFNGGEITTTLAQIYNGQFNLGADTTLVTTGGSGGVVLGGNVIGPHDFTVDTSQSITVDGALNISADGAVELTAGGSVTINPSGSVSTASGDVTLSGNAAGGIGVFVDGGSVTSSGGDISLTGIGGTGASSTPGVHVRTGGSVSTTGSGSITIDGTGASGANFNYGVHLLNAVVEADDGLVDINGVGGGTANNSPGILISGSVVRTTGTGPIVMDASASTAQVTSGGFGFQFIGSIESLGGGDITIAGRSPDNWAFQSIGEISTTGDVTIIADTFNQITSNITGDQVTVRAETPGHDINIGGAVSNDVFGSGGTLGISEAELNLLSAASVVVGRFNGGSITLGGALNYTGTGELSLATGASSSGAEIDVQQPFSAPNADVTFRTDQINLGATVSGSGNLSFTPSPFGTSIGLGDGAVGTLNLTTAEIANLQDGFASIKIGGNGTGVARINAVTFTDPITIEADENHVDGQLTGTGDASITLTEALGTTTTYLAADIVTDGQPVVIDDTLRVDGRTGTIALTSRQIDTTGGGAFPAGADVTFVEAVDVIESGSPRFGDLVVNAGQTGSVVFQSAIGTFDPGTAPVLELSGLTVISSSLDFQASPNNIEELSIEVDSIDLDSLDFGVSGEAYLDARSGISINLPTTVVSSGFGLYLNADVDGNFVGDFDAVAGSRLEAEEIEIYGASVSVGEVISTDSDLFIEATDGDVVLLGNPLPPETQVSGDGDVYIDAPSGSIHQEAGVTLSAGGEIFLTVGAELIVDGTIEGGHTLVSGTALRGGGTLTGPVDAESGSTVAPGSSPGIMNTGDFDLQAGATLEIELGGTTPGNTATNHDQVNVTGSVTLAGVLDLKLFGAFTPTPGDEFTIINNDPADSVMGTFDGIAEGGVVTDGVYSYAVSYTGGDGNDVVLTAVISGTEVALDGGGNLVIADSIGNPDNLTITTTATAYVIASAAGGGPLFTSIAGATGDGTNTVIVPFASVPGTSLLVDTGDGDDLIQLGGPFAPSNSLGDPATNFTIVIDGGNDTDINDVTLGNADPVLSLSVNNVQSLVINGTVQVGAGGFTTDVEGSITFTGGSIVSTSTGSVDLFALPTIILDAASSIQAADGNVRLEANRQPSAEAGSFSGVDINGGSVLVSGTGTLDILGRGGDAGFEQMGVRIRGGGQVQGGTAGLVTIDGIGGATAGDFSYGVDIAGNTTEVSTLGASLSIIGDTTTIAAGGFSRGVSIESGATLSVGGSGDLSITGDGASLATDERNYGVYAGSDATIATADGDITIAGTGGGAGTSGNNIGVYVEDVSASTPTLISAGGTGDILITGVGGNTGGTGAVNAGIFMLGSGVDVQSDDGTIDLDADGSEGSFGLEVTAGATVTSGSDQRVTMRVDSLNMTGASIVNAGTGLIRIEPSTIGTPIDLGGGDVLTGVKVLGISDAEVDRLFAGTKRIDALPSPTTVTSPITSASSLDIRGAAVNVGAILEAEEGLSIRSSGTMTIGANLQGDRDLDDMSGSVILRGDDGLGTLQDISMTDGSNVRGSAISVIGDNLSLFRMTASAGDVFVSAETDASLNHFSSATGHFTVLANDDVLMPNGTHFNRVMEADSDDVGGGNITVTADADADGVGDVLIDPAFNFQLIGASVDVSGAGVQLSRVASKTGDVNITATTFDVDFGNRVVTSAGDLNINAPMGEITQAAGGDISAAGAINFNQAGDLIVDGVIQSDYVVPAGTSLLGSGTIGAVTANNSSTVAPGNSPGILNTGDFNLQAGATLEIELGGTSAGNTATDHDQVNVTGTVMLAGTLDLQQFGGFAALLADSFVILNNDGTDGITGAFAGLPEGATLNDGFNEYTITYQGGTDNNDVVLTATGTKTYFVDTTIDVIDAGDGVTSLREAILAANASAGRDVIAMQIAGAGPHVINLVSSLPTITDPVVIDGYRDSEASVNTLEIGHNANIEWRVDGAALTAGSLFTIDADDVTLRGLSVTNSPQESAIFVNGQRAIIEGNFIGWETDGITRDFSLGGVLINSGASNARIGVDGSVGQRNLIGSDSNGVFVASPSGTATTTFGTLIAGNYFGVDRTGIAGVTSGGFAIQALQPARIGGDQVGLGNVIGGTAGIVAGNPYGDAAIGQVAWYPLDSNPDDRLSTDNIVGSFTTYAAGVRGNGISFPVNDTSAPALIPPSSIDGTAFSIDAWVLPDLSGASVGDVLPIFHQDASGMETFSVSLVATASGADVRVAAEVGGQLRSFVSDGDLITNGGTHHIAITASDDDVRLYVDGDSVGSGAFAGVVLDSASGVKLGNDQADTLGNQYVGVLDDIGVYNRVLRFSEIAGIVAFAGRGKAGSTIQGNIIGLGADGVTPIGNSDGINLNFAFGVTIGGESPAAGNVISNQLLPEGRGILVEGGSTGVTILKNRIGTDATGRFDRGNEASGIQIDGASKSVLIASNLISGNGAAGVDIAGAGTLDIELSGNTIGLAGDGNTVLANGTDGVLVRGGATGVVIGGLQVEQRNVISGNSEHGIRLVGSSTTANVIVGNFIGTDRFGQLDRGNALNGVFLVNSPNNVIGGGLAGARNVISGNDVAGVRLIGAGSSGNTVAGNYIGVGSGGLTGIANGGVSIGAGVWLQNGANNNVIGTNGDQSRDEFEGNVISGNNGFAGVFIESAGSDNNVVAGNIIGLDQTGRIVVGNLGRGVEIKNAASQNRIGTDGDGFSDAFERNIISGNASGLLVWANPTPATDNVIAGNYIGTDISGSLARGNNGPGVLLFDGASGTAWAPMATGLGDADERNLISGNAGIGVLFGGNTTSGNIIAGNFIGTDVSGTGSLANAAGIGLDDSTNNVLGGSLESQGNRIAFNAGVGISELATANGNILSRNLVFQNADLGIDQLGDGRTTNDPADGVQDFVVFDPTMVFAGATTNLEGTVFLEGYVAPGVGPFLQAEVQFFAATTDASIGANATRYLGMTMLDAFSDSLSFDVDLATSSVTGERVTATVRFMGQNSEFADPTTLIAPPAGIAIGQDDLLLIDISDEEEAFGQPTQVVLEGAEVQLQGEFDTANRILPHTVTIDWRDGSSLTQLVLPPGARGFAATHVYANNRIADAAYLIDVRVSRDDGASGLATTTLTVENVPAEFADEPAVRFLRDGVDVSSPREGDTIVVTGGVTDPGGDDVQFINAAWSDGTPVESFVVPAGVGSYELRHVYADDGDLTFALEIRDADSVSATDMRSAVVSLGNVKPVASFFIPDEIREGVPAEFIADITDLGASDTFTYQWTVSDPSGAILSSVQESPFFTFPNEGTYTIDLVATDDDGAASEFARRTVTVLNAAPQLNTFSLSTGTIDEGNTITLSGDFTDTGVNDMHRVRVEVISAGSVIDTFSESIVRGDRSFQIDYFVADDEPTTTSIDTLTLRAVVQDDSPVDAVSQPMDQALIVSNVAPTVLAVDDGSDDTTFRLRADVLDASTLDTFTYLWTIGPDTYSTSSIAVPAFTTAATMLTLRVTDDDGGATERKIAYVAGTSAPDTLTIGVTSNDSATLTVGTGVTQTTISLTDIQQVIVSGLADADNITVNAPSSNLLPVVVNGGDGGDTVMAIQGGDVFVDGGAGNDTITTGAGDDTIIAIGGDDVLSIGDGDDRVFIVPGSDKAITDGGGVDVLDFSRVTNVGPGGTGVVFDLTVSGTQTVDHDAHTVTLAGDFEAVVGTGFKDSLRGGAGDRIDGAFGDDTIYGGGSGDTVDGGEGNDLIFGLPTASGVSSYDGGFGDDTIYGGGGNDVIGGGEGNDLIFAAGPADAGSGSDRYDGGFGDDTIYGGGGDDDVSGGEGNDLIFSARVGEADGGLNSYDGGFGDDTIYGGGGDDDVRGGEGNDLIFSGADTSGVNSYDGGFGDDTIYGGGGDDDVNGGEGNDLIFASEPSGASGGINSYSGGQGSDTIYGGSGDDDVSGGEGNDLIFGVSIGTNGELYDGGLGDDTIYGGSGDDDLRGGEGNDLIFAGQFPVAGVAPESGGGADSIVAGFGDDTIYGGGGDETVDGGGGNDLIFGVDSASGVVRYQGGGGDDTIYGGGGDDDVTGGEGNDLIFASIAPGGGGGTNSYDGGFGNDTIHGGGGDDDVTGGDGNDLIFGVSLLGVAESYNGGGGNDTIYGGGGGDTLAGGEGNDLIFAGQFPIGSGAPGTGGPANVIIGGLGNDTIYGGGGDEGINGGEGNDLIFGSPSGALDASYYGDFGNDTIHGSGGEETIDGGDGNDLIFGGVNDSSPTEVTAYYGQAGEDTIYGGGGDDHVDGGDGNDLIFGGIPVAGVTTHSASGDDLYQGGLGDDTIYGGGGGSDTIEGGDGNDLIFSDGVGAVTADGGEGFDTFDHTSDGDVTLTDSLLNVGTSSGTIARIETARLHGGPNSNWIDGSGFSGDLSLAGGAGDDTLIGNAKDNLIITQGGNDDLRGGDGSDAYKFAASANTQVRIDESSSSDPADSLDFSALMTSVQIDLSNSGVQAIAAGLSVQLVGQIEDVVGTFSNDTIIGNSVANRLFGGGGIDVIDGGDAVAGQPDVLFAGGTRFVHLDFDTQTSGDDHVYTSIERDLILDLVQQDFAAFDVLVTLDVNDLPAGYEELSNGDFVTVFLNGDIAGGISDRIGFRELGSTGTLLVNVNPFLGTRSDSNPLNGLTDSSENFVALSATIAAHELVHFFGARHHDAFGDPGDGLFDPTVTNANPTASRFRPVFGGAANADQTPNHLIASPASIRTSLLDAAGNPYLGPRESLKLAFAESGIVVVEQPDAAKTKLAGTFVQELGVLPAIRVPDVSPDAADDATYPAAAIVVAGSLDLVALDSAIVAEDDHYTFTLSDDAFVTIELMSEALRHRLPERFDSVLRLSDSLGNVIAFNDDTVEPTDSLLFDVPLAAGTYTIDVASFSFLLPELAGGSDNYLSLDANATCAARPELDVCLDQDTGEYELLIYTIDPESVTGGSLLTDTLIGGSGPDFFVGNSGRPFVDGFDISEGDRTFGHFDASAVLPRLEVNALGQNDRILGGDGKTISVTGNILGLAPGETLDDVLIEFGDGSSSRPVPIEDGVIAPIEHTYANEGEYTVVITGASVGRHEIQVTTDAIGLTSDGVLHLSGRASTDFVRLARSGDSLIVSGIVGGPESFSLANLQKISLGLGEGRNYVFADPTIAIPMHIRGGDNFNYIRSGAGDDVITTGSFFDFIDGGHGADTVSSGGGNDRIFVSGDGGIGDVVDAGDGFDTLFLIGGAPVSLGSLDALASSIEGISGSAALVGTPGDDVIDLSMIQRMSIPTIDGLGGDDLIKVNEDASTITEVDGGEGNDTLIGSTGRDILRGGPGDDFIVGGGGADDVWPGSGSDTVTTADGDDRLFAKDDDLVGDTIDLGGGLDRLINAPQVNGGHGQLILQNFDASVFGIEIIDAVGQRIVGTEQADDIDLSGAELINVDLIDGRGGDDRIAASHVSASTIHGGAGADTLVSGAADDRLVGGVGDADSYVFADENGQDVIGGFEVGTDKIDLSNVQAIGKFTQVAQQTTDVGDDVEINTGNDDRIRLLDRALADLMAGDFLF